MNAVNSLCCSSPKSRMMATAEMARSVMNRRADARYFMRVWCLWVKTEGRRCSAVVKTVVKLLILWLTVCLIAWWLFVVFCHGYIFPIKPFAVCFVDALVMVWAYLAFGVHSDYLIRRSASFVAACFSISYCAALLFCSCQFSISERLKKSEPFCL